MVAAGTKPVVQWGAVVVPPVYGTPLPQPDLMPPETAALVQRALADKSPDVRASALRLSERWLAQPDGPMSAVVLKLIDDPSWTVRRQVGASIGELPEPARLGARSAWNLSSGNGPP